MENYFFIDEVPGEFNYSIGVNCIKFKGNWGPGVTTLMPCRVLGISHANFLRLCRDEFGAVLNGKDCLYAYAKFNSQSNIQKLIELLNKKAAKVLDQS